PRPPLRPSRNAGCAPPAAGRRATFCAPPSFKKACCLRRRPRCATRPSPACKPQSPTFGWMLLAIVFFQFITEVIISYNYALGQVTITPMALLMTHLAAPVADSNMPVERVLDTIVGAAIGIAFAVLFSTADDRAYLARRRAKLEAKR